MTMQTDAQQLYTELNSIKDLLQTLQKTVGRLVQAIPPRTLTEHPHVVRVNGVCGGRPIIAGTRISVRTIVERTCLGDSPEQIVADYPPLTLAQVYDGLSYYHEHKAEIVAEIAANQEALTWATRRSAG